MLEGINCHDRNFTGRVGSGYRGRNWDDKDNTLVKRARLVHNFKSRREGRGEEGREG